MTVRSADEMRGIADAYIAECRERRTPPQVNELSAKLGLSAGDFSNLFLKLLGERPSDYFQRARIECAKRLLSTTDLTMKVIADICGFGTVRTFFRSFKSSVGMAPHDFRDRNRR
jgi:transcriptional regulator GlxA family with amidase domain